MELRSSRPDAGSTRISSNAAAERSGTNRWGNCAAMRRAGAVTESIRLLELDDHKRELMSRPLAYERTASVNARLWGLARELRSMSEEIDDPESKRGLELRIELLLNPLNSDLYTELYKLREQELVVLVGDIGTWHRKQTRSLFSCIFSVPNAKYLRLESAVQDCLPILERWLRAVFYPDIYLQCRPQFIVTEQMLVAGEAAQAPRHFAYFLPEDEGMKGHAVKRTLVFIDVYRSLFEERSRPGLHAAVRGLSLAASQADIERHIILWLRGHDLAHGLRLPQTQFAELRFRGKWLSMVLQELLADVIGLSLTTAGPWVSTFALDAQLSAMTFFAEMLRYLRRGPRKFPDSHAAYMELSFLVKNGFVKIGKSGTLKTTASEIICGIDELARSAVPIILGCNLSALMCFLDRYDICEGSPLYGALMHLWDNDTSYSLAPRQIEGASS